MGHTIAQSKIKQPATWWWCRRRGPRYYCLSMFWSVDTDTHIGPKKQLLLHILASGTFLTGKLMQQQDAVHKVSCCCSQRHNIYAGLDAMLCWRAAAATAGRL